MAEQLAEGAAHRAAERLDALLVYIEAASVPWEFSRRPQLGLYYLAQHATDAGFHVLVDCLSGNDYVVERLARVLKERGCGLLGMYVDQDNLWAVRHVLRGLRETCPDLKMILGGPQLTAEPELTLERIPEADCGALGEAEETLVELLSLPDFTAESLARCNGLAVRVGDQVVRTGKRKPLKELDRLSIPRRKELTLDGEAVMPMMITGRGCTGRCAFCYEGRAGRTGRRLRLHSAQRCIEEFDYLARDFDRGYVSILDDTFVANPRRLRVFCEALIKKYRGRIKWFCEARADTLAARPDLLPLMIEAGLVRMQVGGESGVQRILDAYRKGIRVEQIVQVVDAARSHGLLSLYLNFIIGGAFETRETYRETRDFALRLLASAPGCVSVGGSIYTPYPGTPMCEDPGAFGIEVLDPEAVTGMGDRHAFCRTAELSRFDILALHQDFGSSVELAMTTLCNALPYEVLDRHFRALYEYDLSTEWCETASECPAIAGYFRAMHFAGAKRLAAIPEDQLPAACPSRTVDLVASKGTHFVVPVRSGEARELSPLENAVMELSCGKLTFSDILDVLRSRTPQVAMETLREAVLRAYQALDADYLVVWRTPLQGAPNGAPRGVTEPRRAGP